MGNSASLGYSENHNEESQYIEDLAGLEADRAEPKTGTVEKIEKILRKHPRFYRSEKARCFDIIENGVVAKLEKILKKKPKLCNLKKGSHNEGMSLLILASFLDHPDKVNLLLAKGANPDLSCGYGVTALHLACLHGHLAVVKSLLKNGALATTSDEFGQNALHYAASCLKLNRCDIMILLLETKLDINLRDKHERTALHMACLLHHQDCAFLLLDRGVNLHLKDKLGKDAISQIGNEKIRANFLESDYYRRAERLYCQKAFRIVLHQKDFASSYRHALLSQSNTKSTLTLEIETDDNHDNSNDNHLTVFHIKDLCVRICSYL